MRTAHSTFGESDAEDAHERADLRLPASRGAIKSVPWVQASVLLHPPRSEALCVVPEVTIKDLRDQLASVDDSARVFIRFTERNGHGQVLAACDFQIEDVTEDHGNVVIQTEGRVTEIELPLFAEQPA